MKINQNIFRSPEFLYILFFISVLLFFCEVNLTSCNGKVKEKRYTIGFSQCTGADGWRKTMLEEMRRELSFHDNIDFIYKDADGTSQNQVDQIKELVNQNIDLLIVSPNEVTPLSPIIQKVYNSNIPVVVVDRRTDSKKYTAFIGASNYDRKFRAYDKATGELLWETLLPFSNNGTPAIYAINGRQYIVLAAGGGKDWRTKSGGMYVAFALPEKAVSQKGK